MAGDGPPETTPDDDGRAIQTLAPDEISRFLMRTRRDPDPERAMEKYEVRLDEHLREVLARADEFVPSDAGAILLDDPRQKLARERPARLTVIACFGDYGQRLGARVPAEAGLLGDIYASGGGRRSGDAVGVPVVLGESICGVLELRRVEPSAPYLERDLELLGIFGGYISSSILNTLDAIRARELARRDDLTGLYNHRFLHRRLSEELARAEHEGTPLALLFLDLDDFKRVNDSHGHLAGSRVLTEVGELLQATLPPGVVTARYGGDEFCVILPGADAARAAEVAEQLRAAVAARTFLPGMTELDPALGAGVRLTASFGVASALEHVGLFGTAERRHRSLMRLADTAMYAAKAAGKNRVAVAAPEE